MVVICFVGDIRLGKCQLLLFIFTATSANTLQFSQLFDQFWSLYFPRGVYDLFGLKFYESLVNHTQNVKGQ